MSKLKLQAVMVIMTAFFNVLQSQELKGVVVSEKEVPIANVSVSFQNDYITTTDSNGIFILPTEFKIPINLSFTHSDYESLDILFKENSQIFQLKKPVITESLSPILVNARNESVKGILTPTSKIDSQSIAQQSPVDIVSSINQTAGIYIQNGAINTNRITIRGVGARTLYGTNKIRAYFNEIPITSGVGETTIDSYDPEDLKSIEIVKGPKATQYGTNLGGTLLLTSKRPETEGLSFRNNTTVGSYGLFKNTLTSDFSNDRFNFHVTYSHLELDGFRENSNYNRNSILLNSNYKLSDKTELSSLINYNNYTAQIPSSISKSAFEEDPSQAAFTWAQAKGYESEKNTLVALSLKHIFDENFKNTTSVFYTYSDHYEPRPFNILDEYTSGFGARTSFDKGFKFLNGVAEWTFGGEFFKDKYNWKTIENLYDDNNGNGSLEGLLLSKNAEDRKQINVFSSITLPILERLDVQVGVNYNKVNYDYHDEYNYGTSNQDVSRDFDAIVAPNLNVIYQLTARQNIYVNVSYGFNYPSLEEALTPDGIVNPNISPEKGFNYEVGVESYFFNRKWHILTSLYLMDIDDLLVAERVGDDQYIGRNAGQTIHKGLEVSTNYQLVINESFSMSPYVNASFNWHKFENFVSDDTDFSGNDLTGVPDLTIGSGIAFQFKNLALYGNHLYVGQMPMNDGNTLYSDAYNIMNLKIDYEVPLFKAMEMRLNFGINNVFDTQYASAILINATGFNNSEPRYFYPGNPRNYYGGVSLRYHL
ncbi:MAG: TonB-dependent receptor family protein [Aquaticitalea sp.]